MNSFQESKNELEAAIRYAENAISAAQTTIESMQFRQDMAKKEYEERTGREQALEAEVVQLKSELDKLRKEKEASSGPCGCQAYRDLEERATMPVIPKAVAIAIFREGMAYGASNVCDELDTAASDIEITDRESIGNFEVEYTQYVDLSEHLDTDYLRSKAVDNSDEEWVVDCLKNLCADNKFECRIHGVDDNED